tara:strand:+ start:2572 stop:3321 length:750 start_codon:yes stop_codon:yes gene_type:complete
MLRLYSAGEIIPHPRKAYRGGEDSYIVSSPTNSTLAVADGVGGWESKGVNPRAFADQILRSTYEFIKSGDDNPYTALQAGYELTTETGSSTVCIGKMTADGVFRVVNMGDSGFLIIRNQKIFLQSSEHQHEFNFPYQLGRDFEGNPHGNDRPTDAEIYQITLEVGDIVVMGSDGLFDNVWPNEILNFVNQNAPNPMVMAKGLAKIAYENSQDDSNYVPFFHRAKEADAGFSNYQGGKEDDITALIGIVN